MRLPDLLFGPHRSLKRGLLVNITVALFACIALAGSILIKEFYEHLAENLEDAMKDEATEIIGQINPGLPDYGLDASALRFSGVEGAYRYTVFDATGAVIAGGETSDAIWQQLSHIRLADPQPIRLPGDRLGIGMRARIMELDFVVLVSTFPQGSNEPPLAKLAHEVEEEFWWLVLGVATIFAAAILATRSAMAPLYALSDQAHEIGPSRSGKRLQTDQVPTEIAPLIEDINKAFDRLEQGYKAQRDFSSNVAHEVRTPLAVLRSSIERIGDRDLRAALSQDVALLDRIFSELIDLARADAASRQGFEQVELHAVAVETASDLAHEALRSGRSLSVTGARHVIADGNKGLLQIAMRNLLRNALQYTPRDSDVEIELLADPAGWRVLDRGAGVPDDLKLALFERFNRGGQANSRTDGSGIGLAVVKSVAKRHDATVSVQDRDGGGSIFSFIFNTPGPS